MYLSRSLPARMFQTLGVFEKFVQKMFVLVFRPLRSGMKKSSLKITFLGRIFLGPRDPHVADIPDPGVWAVRDKSFMQGAFSLLF